MNGSVLVDTNIIIAIFAKDPEVLHRVEAADELFVPVIALGELHHGL